jgi:predicted DNA-binding WGR domain protein
VTIKKVQTADGPRWELRGRLGGRGSRSIRRYFDRKEDAERVCTELLRQKQMVGVVTFSKLTLDEYGPGVVEAGRG